MGALRRRLGAAQARIGQAPDAMKGGNYTKRIRLRVEVPGYRHSDAGQLGRTLGTCVISLRYSRRRIALAY
jgi:hypothetical protein